jgi:hypothetical protein
MLPFAASLLTSMNPFLAKIWIGGRTARHTSVWGELARIVPSRASPDPAKRRSRRSPGGDAARWIVAGAAVLRLAGACAAGALVLALRAGVLCARVAVPGLVPRPPTVFPATTVAGRLEAVVWVVALVEPPPHPAKRIAADEAASDSTGAAAKRLGGESALIEDSPTG